MMGPRFKQWKLTDQYEFERSLFPGLIVLARWTNSGNQWQAFAEIAKPNRQSARVRLLGEYYATKPKESVAYNPGRYYYNPGAELVITLQGDSFSAHSKWSVNNGIFPLSWLQAILMDDWDAAEKEKNRDRIRERLAREMLDLDAMMDRATTRPQEV